MSVVGLFFFTTILMGFQDLPDQPTQIFGDFVWHQSYQDQVVNNQIVAQGRVTGLEARYEQLEAIVKKYKRSGTMIDIGSAQGYFPFRLAHTFKDWVFVMIEEDPYLQRLCQRNTDLDNIIFLQKRVTPQELRRLGECEHFDVVLALNVIHWSEENWQEMADAILSLGDRIVIETPPAGDKAIGAPYLGDIERYLEAQGGKVILQSPRHTQPNLLANMYLVTQNKTFISRSSWFEEPTKYAYKIKSILKEKKIIKRIERDGKREFVEQDWKPGINLLTFKMLNGVYPVVNTLHQSLADLGMKDLLYKEPIISNFIIQGNSIVPIEASVSTAPLAQNFNAVLHYVSQLLSMSAAQIEVLESTEV